MYIVFRNLTSRHILLADTLTAKVAIAKLLIYMIILSRYQSFGLVVKERVAQ